MKKLMLLTVLVLSSFLLQAQKNYAVGVVDSKTGKPIVGAFIKIMSTGTISTTSESGNVVMTISSNDSLFITAKGYKDRKLLMAGQFVALSIILDPVSSKEKTVKQKNTKQRSH